MPVLPRATFFFKQGEYGWTETYHSTKPDLPQTLAAAVAMIPFRVNLLGAGCNLAYIRVSDDLVKRDSMIYSVPRDDQFSPQWDNVRSTNPTTCLNCRLQATNVLRRNLSMRGIPGELIDIKGAYQPNAQWIVQFGNWAVRLKNGGFAVKGKDPLTTEYLIGSISQNLTTGDVTVQTILTNTFAPQDLITIRGVKGATQLNGNWSILSVVDSTHFTLKVNRILNPYAGGGKVSKLSYTLGAITDVIDRNISHRIAGRPFDSPRGRRSST